MAGQVYFEAVHEGMELAVMVNNASRAQLFRYSAATWNPHRIHYDKDYAATEWHSDVLVCAARLALRRFGARTTMI